MDDIRSHSEESDLFVSHRQKDISIIASNMPAMKDASMKIVFQASQVEASFPDGSITYSSEDIHVKERPQGRIVLEFRQGNDMEHIVRLYVIPPEQDWRLTANYSWALTMASMSNCIPNNAKESSWLYWNKENNVHSQMQVFSDTDLFSTDSVTLHFEPMDRFPWSKKNSVFSKVSANKIVLKDFLLGVNSNFNSQEDDNSTAHHHRPCDFTVCDIVDGIVASESMMGIPVPALEGVPIYVLSLAVLVPAVVVLLGVVRFLQRRKNTKDYAPIGAVETELDDMTGDGDDDDDEDAEGGMGLNLSSSRQHRAAPFLGSVLLLCLSLQIIPVVTAADNNDNVCPQKYTLTIPEAAVKTHTNKNKLIIAHRGASFHLPEHTIAAYRLALEMGADFIEPDLVATQDGHLIALHTADLNVTTNVLEQFGKTRQPWFSPFVNRSGYWTFNFTLDEIKQLRVHQRLPRARTTAYDGMFQVPTFLEIQTLVNEWNMERIPDMLLHIDANGTKEIPPEHQHYQQTAGVYAELKSSPWFQQDANLNLVDLFLQEIDGNTDLFASVLECPDIFKFDEFKVPPLIVQCFEGSVLQEVTEKWKDHPVLQKAPVPPMILLLNQHNCWEESVWFEIGETWRAYIQGLGMDKACFPKTGDKVEEGMGAKGRAEEFNLVIHPYTERPEHEFLMEGFQDGFEETQYLLCTIGAQGVFTESIHTARMAARTGCGDDENKQGEEEDASGEEAETAVGKPDEDSSASAATANRGEIKKSLCWEDTSEANLYLGVASFILGAFVTAMISMWVNRGFSCTPRPPRQQQIPTREEEMAGDGGIEEPPDDELL